MRAQLLIVALVACGITSSLGQNLPELGDVSAGTLSPQMERRIGEEAYRDIRRRNPKFLDDPEITAYVSELGARLVTASSESRQAFEFFVIQDPSINAFAMPGGYVGVHTGLLLATQTESEIASVLAHEVAHVTQHHIARMFARDSQVSALSLAASILALLAARSNPEMGHAALASATAGSIQAQLDYSREFEREADRLGFQLLRDAGFDVHAMPLFFERLQKAIRLIDSSAPAYLRTHPLTTERMADMQNRAQGIPYKQVPDRLEFHLIRARLRADLGTPRDAVELAESQLRDKRYSSLAAARYAVVAAQIRARSFQAAERGLAELRQSGTAHPMIETLAARLHSARGDHAAAGAVLRAARARYPNYWPIGYALAAAYQALSQHAEALGEIQGLLTSHPRDARLHGLRAKSLAAIGQRMQSHQALAEQYYLWGSLPAAIEQLQLAQKTGQGDFYQLSVVEARLRQIRAELGDQVKYR